MLFARGSRLHLALARHAIAGGLSLCASLGARTAFADPAMDAAKKQGDTVFELLSTNVRDESRLAKEIDGAFGYRDIAARALGDEWHDLSTEQKDEFTSLLSRLVPRTYERYMSTLVDYDVRYTGTVAFRKGVTLVTMRAVHRTDKRAPPIEFDVELAHRGDCVYQIVDMTLDGVTLIDTYRYEFARVVRKNGMDALFDKLRKRAALRA